MAPPLALPRADANGRLGAPGDVALGASLHCTKRVLLHEVGRHAVVPQPSRPQLVKVNEQHPFGSVLKLEQALGQHPHLRVVRVHAQERVAAHVELTATALGRRGRGYGVAVWPQCHSCGLVPIPGYHTHAAALEQCWYLCLELSSYAPPAIDRVHVHTADLQCNARCPIRKQLQRRRLGGSSRRQEDRRCHRHQHPWD
eukprot:scaffold64510_cov59-Phaeocystis_antarctica.AAC.4